VLGEAAVGAAAGRQGEIPASFFRSHVLIKSFTQQSDIRVGKSFTQQSDIRVGKSFTQQVFFKND